MHISALSLTLALDIGGCSTKCPGRFNPGKLRYRLHSRLGGPHGLSGRMRNISPPLEFDTRTVQPAASRYTGYAIPAHMIKIVVLNIQFSLFIVNGLTQTSGGNSGRSCTYWICS
jgi:hypothetical protein